MPESPRTAAASARTLAGKTAVVTGGGSGIGRAIAEALVGAGVRVAVAGRTRDGIARAEDALNALARDRAGFGRCLGIVLDVRDAAAVEAAFADVAAAFDGAPDILIAAAGTPGSLARARRLPYTVARMPVEEWDEVIDTNLKGIFNCNRAALTSMVERRAGDIINVASYPGALRGSAGGAAYCAAKHAVMLMTDCLAGELRAHGVRVQAVLPGATDTPLLYGAGGGWMAARGVMRPASVAACVVDLLRAPPDCMLWRSTILPFPEAGDAPEGGGPE
jgi:3-oxoacyl-[acyl-carrier protein] reductase